MSGGVKMPDPTLQRYSHKTFDPAPWPITEPNHYTNVFEKLRLQREQGRFCDVILKVRLKLLFKLLSDSTSLGKRERLSCPQVCACLMFQQIRHNVQST